MSDGHEAKDPSTRRRKPQGGQGSRSAAQSRTNNNESAARGRGDLTPQQLRQRRNRIIQDKFQEVNEEKKWRDISEQGKKRHGFYMTKLYLVVGTAVVISLVAALNHTRPAFLYNRKKPPPPMFLATVFPRDVVMERDLPRFFQTYSIATPNNKHARAAAIQVANSRSALKQHTGRLKVILKAWDTTNVDLLLERNVCGRQFERAYRSSSTERQDDLLMWCLLTTEIAEGFFLGSVEVINNAFILAKQRGMIVRKADAEGQISNAYYLHPRLPTGEEDTAPLPAMMLSWLLEHPEETLEKDATTALQESLYEIAMSGAHRDRYMILNEVCQAPKPKRALAKQCRSEVMGDCCYFVVPDAEGGRIDLDAEKEEEITERRRSLREGVKDDNDEQGSM